MGNDVMTFTKSIEDAESATTNAEIVDVLRNIHDRLQNANHAIAVDNAAQITKALISNLEK